MGAFHLVVNQKLGDQCCLHDHRAHPASTTSQLYTKGSVHGESSMTVNAIGRGQRSLLRVLKSQAKKLPAAKNQTANTMAG